MLLGLGLVGGGFVVVGSFVGVRGGSAGREDPLQHFGCIGRRKGCGSTQMHRVVSDFGNDGGGAVSLLFVTYRRRLN